MLERGGRNVDMRKEGRVAARVRESEIVLLIDFYMWVTGLGFCGLLDSGLAFEHIKIFF